LSTIGGVGSVPLSKSLTLRNVLHVIFLSISKLTHDLKSLAIFNFSTCKFQEWNLGRMIGSTRECRSEDELVFKEKIKLKVIVPI